MELKIEPTSCKKISMTTLDGVLFEVEHAVAMEFETVRAFIEEEDDSSSSMIPLPNVSSDALTKIIDYCKSHQEFREKEKTMDEKDRDKLLKNPEKARYDNEYLENLSNDDIKELILAANYLNVKDLLDFLVQAAADRIKNKSVQYVRDFFGIESDYTPEEEEQLRLDYQWAWDDVDED